LAPYVQDMKPTFEQVRRPEDITLPQYNFPT